MEEYIDQKNLKTISKGKEFDIFDAALATLLFVIFNFLFSFVYGLLPKSIRSNNSFFYYVAFFINEFLFGVAAFLTAKMRGVNFRENTGITKRVNGKLALFAFLTAVVCLYFFSDLTQVFLDFLSLLGYRQILGDIAINNFWQYLAYVLVACITPAVCEEVLFRGVIASGFKKFGNAVAICLSALIFMLMHGNAEQTIHQFLIGLILGYIFISTGNIWVGVLIHFFNNFISVTSGYIVQNITVVETATEAAPQITVSPWLALLVELITAVIFALIGFAILKWLLKKIKQESSKINDVAAENSNTTILVDGKEQAAVMEIDGNEVGHDDEQNLTEGDGEKKIESKPSVSFGTIALFAISGAYLIFEWVLALLQGFGVV